MKLKVFLAGFQCSKSFVSVCFNCHNFLLMGFVFVQKYLPSCELGASHIQAVNKQTNKKLYFQG